MTFSPCFDNMVAPNHVEIDADGNLVTVAPNCPGFPTLLWSVLQSFGCTEPPKYIGHKYNEPVLGLASYEVEMTIATHSNRADRYQWTTWALVLVLRRPWR